MPLKLDGTYGVSGVDGSNTTPSVRGGTSASNGVFYGTNTVSIATNATTAVTVDSSQNVGIGVTPSTWSLGKAIEINTVGNSVWATSTAYVMGNNFYYNGGYKFAGTGYATSYIQSTGAHVWNASTASGTAGNAITFTQAMTLDTSGNLLVGTTSSGGKVTVAATPTSQWNMDFSQCTVTITNGSNAVIPTGSGMIVVNEQGFNGDAAIYLMGGGYVNLIGGTGSGFWVASTSAPAAGKASVAWSGSNYRIYNNQGNTITVAVFMPRTRNAY